ncbi:flagellar hook-associated protein FlgK [Clostridium sp.]|uniref:flagellar hook-associated protein FlgK n=1 Tax=Clostridium sp. TaxID=1506 RepID=UPI002FC7D827
MSGLFSTLNISKGAMFAQQQQINVTSHNISNAGTPGYSRQNLILQTGRPQTVTGAGQVGTGVVVSEVQRARNIFLDYQIRKESSHKGQYGIREQYLTEIESVFNEPSDSGISKLMSEFFDGWQSLSTNAEKSDARTIVAQKAKTLADELNRTHGKLNAIKENSKAEIQQSLFDINNIFDQLNSINDEIKTVTVAGNNPNDLMDRRDLLLDELSSKFGINTKNETYNSMKLTPDGLNDINLINTDGSTPVKKLAFVNKIDYIKDASGNITSATIQCYKNGDVTSPKNKFELTISGTAGAPLDSDSLKQLENIEKTRNLWTEEKGDGSGAISIGFGTGKIDINVPTTTPVAITKENLDGSYFTPSSGAFGGILSIYKDVDAYIGQLDSLAKALAYSVNAIHTEGYVPASGTSINFFESSNGNIDEITAGTIKVNEDILSDAMKIQTGVSGTSGSTDGARALAIAQLRDLAMGIQNIDKNTTYATFKGNEFTLPAGETILKGNNSSSGMKIEAFYKNSINKLGIQAQEAQRIVKNQETLLEGLLTRRASVSGVSMDEEMVNLVQFQHAYQANAKMISTVDELLDVVINGLKR